MSHVLAQGTNEPHREHGIEIAGTVASLCSVLEGAPVDCPRCGSVFQVEANDRLYAYGDVSSEKSVNCTPSVYVRCPVCESRIRGDRADLLRKPIRLEVVTIADLVVAFAAALRLGHRLPPGDLSAPVAQIRMGSQIFEAIRYQGKRESDILASDLDFPTGLPAAVLNLTEGKTLVTETAGPASERLLWTMHYEGEPLTLFDLIPIGTRFRFRSGTPTSGSAFVKTTPTFRGETIRNAMGLTGTYAGKEVFVGTGMRVVPLLSA